jgi:small subunit ribosomal protein S9
VAFRSNRNATEGVPYKSRPETSTVAEVKAKKQYHLGTGRRKTAVARVRLTEGTGQITINGRSVEQYFTEDKDRSAVYGPLDLTDMRKRLDVIITITGGGFTGQAGAASQGLARALKTMFGGQPEEQPPDGQEGVAGPTGMVKKLRDSGYLTRDQRMKERKKYGRKGARKSFQFSKR